jgi:hypothetical protein
MHLRSDAAYEGRGFDTLALALLYPEFPADRADFGPDLSPIDVEDALQKIHR